MTKADASEEKVQLDKLIEQAEALESDMFTEESWTPVETALTEAKAIDDGLKSEYNAAIEKTEHRIKRTGRHRTSDSSCRKTVCKGL